MTARTAWCSLWKPSLQKKTALLKYQTQKWIPLQTRSCFFTVGLHLCLCLGSLVKRLHTADDIQDLLLLSLCCAFKAVCLARSNKAFLLAFEATLHFNLLVGFPRVSADSRESGMRRIWHELPNSFIMLLGRDIRSNLFECADSSAAWRVRLPV